MFRAAGSELQLARGGAIGVGGRVGELQEGVEGAAPELAWTSLPGVLPAPTGRYPAGTPHTLARDRSGRDCRRLDPAGHPRSRDPGCRARARGLGTRVRPNRARVGCRGGVDPRADRRRTTLLVKLAPVGEGSGAGVARAAGRGGCRRLLSGHVGRMMSSPAASATHPCAKALFATHPHGGLQPLPRHRAP